MKKTTLSLLSLILATVMVLGALASCTGGDQPSGSDPTSPADQTNPVESGSTESTSAESESDETDNAGGEETGDVIPPSIEEIDNGLLISNANALANGVNAYFTDGKRTDFMLENRNMQLLYALSANQKQQVTSLVNTQGKAYITNTSDAFVKMANGNVFYTSNSTKPATANLYRFGYYMYEARFEEQNFMGSPIEDGALDVSLENVGKSQVKVTENDDGSISVLIANTTDPYITFRNVSYSANEYPYLQVTLKANTKSTRGLSVYLSTDAKSMSQAGTVLVSPSEEYATYIVPLFRTSWYTGNVTGLRLDFPASANSKGETYDILEVKLMKGNVEGTPEKLGINRSYFVYSDKMHHVLQIATDSVATENIASAGLETRIAKNTVSKVVVKDKNGISYSFDGADWDSAEYVGFDITEAGIFGYILPAGELTDKLEVIDDGEYYVIIQSRTPENNTILPSGVYNSETGKYDALVDDNANDFYMGQRIYTDESHDFEAFLYEAYNERNPLTAANFTISKRESSYIATFECPNCGFKSEENMLTCSECFEDVQFIEHANMYFKEYDALRGLYTFWVPSESFNAPYFQYPNKYVNLTFVIKGDDRDRNIYFMTASGSGCLECAVLLDENKMMLPVPIEVGKNFSEGSGERNLWNIQDNLYGEAIIPMVIKSGSEDKYSFLNLYQNWGQYPLKQVSWIQFYAPYYHLSTGVTESNCIVPYYSCKNARGLGTLPDHRAMSAHLWSGQPQHTSGGSHRWLMYTDANGVYSASENTLDFIDSYGPIYADVYMDYLSDDGNIKVSYTHMEFPQTDENRAYYEMKYEVLGDVSFTDFSRDFCFYDVGDNDAKGTYDNVGYLNENNESVIVNAAQGNESFKYVLGTDCPYFSFFNMPDYDRNSTSAEGFTNLSFLIYNHEIIINGEKSDAKFVIINEDDRVRLSLDLGKVNLKKGDTITINAIVMPWGDETLDYSVHGDKNVRDVRENTLLNPLTPTAIENAELIESVFLPRIKSTNGKTATFNLTGGQNNVAVRVYGFTKLTVPVIEELVDGEWVEYRTSSAYKPDKYGNAFYYDGYSVHYDADGTFSYAFIVPMDYTDADGRTFRISCEDDFAEWPKKLPEIEQEVVELPMNVFVTAEDISIEAKNQAGKMFGGIQLFYDSSYVTLSSNSQAQEAYFTIWAGDGQKTVTGQYVVLKYRLPTENNRKHRYFEIFTTTKSNGSIACFGVSNALINDGEWHTLVIDMASYNKDSFTPDGDEYKARSIRLDLYNDYYADGNSIDIAFFGMSDSLEEIRAYHEVDSINVFRSNGTITSYDKAGNEIETPSDNAASTTVEGFDFYLSTSAITSAALSDSGHSGRTVSSSDGKYVTLHYDKQRARLESYVTLFSGNTKPTGQYLVLKYRAQKQAGSIEFYCSTVADGAKSGLNFNLNHDKNYTFIADDQWHTVVIDLAGVLKKEVFAANDNGEYIVKFLRIDLFNFDSAKDDDYSVDIAYLGFCDSYEEAISHEENTWYYDGKQSINVTTGEPLTSPQVTPDQGGDNEGDTADIEDAVSDVAGYNVYINPTKLTATGKNTLWKDHTVLASDGSYTTFKNYVTAEKSEHANESYFTFYKSDEGKATGQYAVIKYRANVQQGSITIWSSTENAGPASGSNFDLYAADSNGLFIADDQWHIVIIDLSKLISSFTPTNGKYAATHLRVDFFNFDKKRDPADTQAQVDVAYLGLCDDFSEIICSDKSVAEIIFYNGKMYKYSTEDAALIYMPEGGEDPMNPSEPQAPIFTKYFNATSIIKASESGGGHRGGADLIDGNIARIYNCIDPEASNAARMESYFSLFTGNTAVTGKYLVVKYRATHQTGYMEFYTSTQNAGASNKGNFATYKSPDLFVADGEWRIIVIDLELATATYTANAEGSYVATHLRIDLFNFGSPNDSGEKVYVDLEYVAMCENASLLQFAETDKVTFYNGAN